MMLELNMAKVIYKTSKKFIFCGNLTLQVLDIEVFFPKIQIVSFLFALWNYFYWFVTLLNAMRWGKHKILAYFFLKDSESFIWMNKIHLYI